MDPKVTVIMPVHNRAGFVREAIASVLAQTFADFELVVVDDGSTDDTPARLAAIEDRRLRCVRQPHRGISAAMNRGLDEARGAYIGRLDSDDVWLPALLATQVAVLDARPEVAVAYARGRRIAADGTPTDELWGTAPYDAGDPLGSMLRGDFTCNITTVARRACLERAGRFDESLPTNEDWDLWLRVARHGRFAFTDRELARFRSHPDNITGPTSPLFRATLEGRRRVLDKFFAEPDLPAAARALRPIAYRNLEVDVGLRWLAVGARRDAWSAFGRALRAGGNPLATALRIAWFVANWQFLSHHAWGRRLIDWQSAARRRRRTAAGA